MKLIFLLVLLFDLGLISAHDHVVTSQVSGMTTIIFTSTLPVDQAATIVPEKHSTKKSSKKGESRTSHGGTKAHTPAGKATDEETLTPTDDATSTIVEPTSDIPTSTNTYPFTTPTSHSFSLSTGNTKQIDSVPIDSDSVTQTVDNPTPSATESLAGNIKPSVGLFSSDGDTVKRIHMCLLIGGLFVVIQLM